LKEAVALRHSSKALRDPVLKFGDASMKETGTGIGKRALRGDIRAAQPVRLGARLGNLRLIGLGVAGLKRELVRVGAAGRNASLGAPLD
jgi:hypothetical protein